MTTATVPSVNLKQARIDLAAALRYAVRLGLNEGIDNHFSCAVSPEGDQFLVNPHGFHWSELKASDLILADKDRNILDGKPGHFVEDTAFYIHSRLHLNQPRARCVLHTHMPYATALCLVEGGRLEMVEQKAIMFHDRIAYLDDYEGLALDAGEGDRLARSMGDKDIAFLGAHGVIVTAPTIASAFDQLYFLERACQVQVIARSTGLPFRHLPDRVLRETATQMAQALDSGKLHFEALKRVLDREEGDYKT